MRPARAQPPPKDKKADTQASSPDAGGILTIDLGAVAANWRTLSNSVAPAECAAVVKADGYGCGIEAVSEALVKAGCRTLFVAHLDEGRKVRALASEATIYVLNGLLPGMGEDYAKDRLRPVLGSVLEVEEWQAFIAGTGWSGGAALHIDTGMNRLGLTFEEAQTLAPSISGINLVMSHLACADTPAHPLNARQMAAFRTVRALYPGIPGSLANSSGIFLGPDSHHEMARPGVALFGGNPTPGHPNPMLPVVNLRGRILQVRIVPQGETVGYGATWTAHRPSTIAIVSIGYGDGFMRSATASDDKFGAEAIVAGQRCHLAGIISMDLLAVDVTDLDSNAVRRGDFVTVIGDGIDIDNLAARAGTIGYEVLTNLGRRYARLYKGA